MPILPQSKFMDTEKFKNIVGEAKNGGIATIRFFGKVTEDSTTQFNYEFDYLENVVRPSLIRVLINSEGGSVLYGMGTYSTIQNSTVPTECIIEGMAASMGSIIWAAGNKSLMRDYSILMIHNPFQPDGEEEKEPSELVKAFTKQIETIYRKRFGLKAELVRAIMDGAAEKDGTFFDAAGAVRAGIIPAESVLHTSKQICERVKNELSGVEDVTRIQTLMTAISASLPAEEGNKLFDEETTNLHEINKNMSTEKTNSLEYAAVAATLGLKDNYEVKDVMARLNTLVSVEAKLKETEKSLTDAQTVIAGKDATITNLQKDLTTATASLSAYQQKEAAEKKAKNESVIEAAIEAGKITLESKEGWLAMAESNPELVERTLASIPNREQISKEIANDPANIQAAAGALKTAEDKIAEKVTQVVGENFEFKKIQ
jgi:ATP-dependent protease ClpP protease subunit